jgi:hypothetical protein
MERAHVTFVCSHVLDTHHHHIVQASGPRRRCGTSGRNWKKPATMYVHCRVQPSCETFPPAEPPPPSCPALYLASFCAAVTPFDPARSWTR